jgi:magnesium-transporting ATPase (P-type)
MLTKGDRVPTNLRVIDGVKLSVNESLLTGM